MEMNETKIMTIQDCKLTLDEVRLIIEGHKENRSTPSEAMQFDYVLSLLARVEQPAEEDRAVIWLIREKGYVILREKNIWAKQRLPGMFLFDAINPAEEAKKLGWGG